MYWAKAGIFNIKLIIDLLLTQKKKTLLYGSDI